MVKANKISKAFAWKLLERFGVFGAQFIIQIVLARILDPAHYGVLAIITIFTSLANVFVQNGFNTALVQNKDVTEEDYSSVLNVTLMIASALYLCIYFCAPIIGVFYKMPEVVAPIRVLALMLFPGALNSIQIAKVSRELRFRKVFFSNIIAILVSGCVGVLVAYNGGGIWALIIQNMLNSAIACGIMIFTVPVKFSLYCNWKRVKVLFSFGWKLLVASFVDTLYQDLRSLVIGKIYTSDVLGYYNRGKQFPQYIIMSINGAVQSVMLPVMSAEQDSKEQVKKMMRNSISLSAYLVFPMMAGLAGIAKPLIELILTEKWLPCVPYLQICCFSYALYPMKSCNLQAINAVGRSDIYLKLEVIKKVIGISTLIIAVVSVGTPVSIALSGAVATALGFFAETYPNRKLIGYSFSEQIRDVLPSLIVSLIMLMCVLLIGQMELAPLALMVIQMAVGVVVYITLSAVTKMKPFISLITTLKLRVTLRS